jgi:hypothetical protein
MLPPPSLPFLFWRGRGREEIAVASAEAVAIKPQDLFSSIAEMEAAVLGRTDWTVPTQTRPI